MFSGKENVLQRTMPRRDVKGKRKINFYQLPYTHTLHVASIKWRARERERER